MVAEANRCRQVQGLPVVPHARAYMKNIWTTLHLPALGHRKRSI